MGAAELLERLHSEGLHLAVVADGIAVQPSERLTDAHRQAIRAHKAELVALLATAPKPEPAPSPMSPRPHRLTREQQDAAHTPCWSEPEIQTFIARTVLFIRRGIDATDADDLAEALVLRDRDGDDRRLCLECRHLERGGHCALARAGRLHGIARDFKPLATVPQRCEGFAP